MQERLKAIKQANKLSNKGLACYLGVPPATVVKWLSGDRTPSAALIKLIDVLEMLAVIAPDIHNQLIDEAKHGNTSINS
jgi:DNA-binding transcriptional regulator YiaG